MGVNRRQFLLGGLGLAAAATTMGLTGCAPGSSNSGGGGGDAGTADLPFAWWGNDVRNKNTTAAIDAYTKANPGVKIAPQPGEFEQLLGQAGHPDRRQHRSRRHPDGHGLHRRVRQPRALLDLCQGRHLEVHRGHRRLRQDQRHAVGINAGINCLVVLANPKIFEKAEHGRARRQDLDLGLDDRHGRRGGVQGQGDVRVRSRWSARTCSRPGSASRARSCSPRTALGFDAADVTGLVRLLVKAQKAGAIGSPPQISEEVRPSRSTRARIAVGTAAMRCPTPTSWRPSPRRPGPSWRCCAIPTPRPATPPSARPGTRRRCCGRRRPRPRTRTPWSPSSTGW